MIVTRDQLNAIMPLGNSSGRLDAHWPYINPALEAFNMTRLRNVTMFLTQVSHESKEYLYTREIHDGSDYEGRTDLGNIYPGDGRKYRGRGAIQNTGRAVARACGQFFDQPFEEQPEMMEQPEWATHVSCFFWMKYKTMYSRSAKKSLAFLPLFSEMDWVLAVTKGVNGGYNGLDDRLMYWRRAQEVFGMPIVSHLTEKDRIRSFQQTAGLAVDGDAGGETANAIERWLVEGVCK